MMTQKIFNQLLKDEILKSFRLFDNDDGRQISCAVAGQKQFQRDKKNIHSGQNKKRHRPNTVSCTNLKPRRKGVR